MKKAKSKYLILLLIVIGAVVLGIGGYHFVTQLTVVRKIESWKTYTNSIHRVMFKYPSFWQIGETSEQSQRNTLVTLTKGKAKIEIYLDLYGIGGKGRTYQGQPFTLDGNSVYLYRTTNDYDKTQQLGVSDSLINTLGIFEIDGKIYSITLRYPLNDTQTEVGDSLEKEFDQILSTFKFIN